mgnify:CR=1 FL=1
MSVSVFFCQAEDGIRDLVRSRGLGDVYKRQTLRSPRVCTTADAAAARYAGRALVAYRQQTPDEGDPCRDRGIRLLPLGRPVSYTHLRAHETVLDLVCRLLLDKKKDTDDHTGSRTVERQHLVMALYCYITTTDSEHSDNRFTQ